MTAQPPPLPSAPKALEFGDPPPPYGPPAPPQTESAWRDGDTLVVRKGLILPHRCVRCNTPVTGRFTKQTVYWHPPVLYLMLLAGLIPYALVMTALQERGSLGVHVCDRHRRRRHLRVVAACVFAVVGFAILIFPDVLDRRTSAGVGALMVLSGAVLAVGTGWLKARKIDRQFIWLKGLPADFLSDFPPLPRRPW